MKKVMLIIGIVLVVLALISFAISLLQHHVATSVLDASNDFIHRAFKRSTVFLFVGIGLALPGVAAIVSAFLFFGKPQTIATGELISFNYSPGYGDMNGEYHYESLQKDENGKWVIICRDREDHESPIIETTYAVSEADVYTFDEFMKEQNFAALSLRKESDLFITDYHSWSYSIDYDNSGFGGDKRFYVRISEYHDYSDADNKLMKEVLERFRGLRGKQISVVTETED